MTEQAVEPMGATTAAYISAHSSDARYVVGGPAAAADPAATYLGAHRSTITVEAIFGDTAAVSAAVVAAG
ncbi:MAG: hypothetical protein ACRDY2_01810 [Acidimicrobiales bacterium]